VVAVNSLSETSVIAAGDEVVSCDLAGGAALLDLRSSTYYSLNAVGYEIWGLVKEPRAVSDIRDELLARYDVDPARCYDDLVALLRKLADAGLIRVVDATVP
jgi:hypothetical protein